MIHEYQKGVKTEITENFDSTEFDCHCTYPDCQITYVDFDLVNWLQKKRDEWGKTILIDSGFRCTRHNRNVGGKKGSYHLIGKAADIKVLGMLPEEVADACEDFHGLGRYPTFTHVDVRGYKSRWRG